jgi:hypothetical protein
MDVEQLLHDQLPATGLQGIEIVVDGARREVEVGRYAKALTDTVWLLQQIDRLAFKEAPRLRWVVSDTSSNGVFRAKILPRTIPHKRPAFSAQVPPQALVEGLVSLTARAEIPDLFTEASVQRVDRLGDPTGGIRGVQLASISDTGSIGQPVRVDEVLRQHARSAIAPQERSVGSVSGLLDVLNARRRGVLRGSIYNQRTRHAVTCLIPAERVDEVAGAFGHRVLVGGPLTRNELGQVIRIELVDLLVQPDDFRVPTVDEILGIDPNWTGELTTDEYLARVRGA